MHEAGQDLQGPPWDVPATAGPARGAPRTQSSGRAPNSRPQSAAAGQEAASRGVGAGPGRGALVRHARLRPALCRHIPRRRAPLARPCRSGWPARRPRCAARSEEAEGARLLEGTAWLMARHHTAARGGQHTPLLLLRLALHPALQAMLQPTLFAHLQVVEGAVGRLRDAGGPRLQLALGGGGDLRQRWGWRAGEGRHVKGRAGEQAGWHGHGGHTGHAHRAALWWHWDGPYAAWLPRATGQFAPQGILPAAPPHLAALVVDQEGVQGRLVLAALQRRVKGLGQAVGQVLQGEGRQTQLMQVGTPGRCV